VNFGHIGPHALKDLIPTHRPFAALPGASCT
jgi:hypothetical protein